MYSRWMNSLQYCAYPNNHNLRYLRTFCYTLIFNMATQSFTCQQIKTFQLNVFCLVSRTPQRWSMTSSLMRSRSSALGHAKSNLNTYAMATLWSESWMWNSTTFSNGNWNWWLFTLFDKDFVKWTEGDSGAHWLWQDLGRYKGKMKLKDICVTWQARNVKILM